MTRYEKLDVVPLVRAASAGDTAAWNRLVTEISPILRRAAAGFRLRDHDIDDVLQIAWMQAFTRLHTLREPAAFVGWMLITARREALRTFQLGVREILTEDNAIMDAADLVNVEDIVVEREIDDAVHDAVERLPQRQRTLLRQMLLAPSARYDELAKVLEMPIGSIGPTRERAIARLRDDKHLMSLTA